MHDKILAVTDHRGKKVAGLPNMTLGTGLHRALKQMIHQKEVKKISPEDKQHLSYILQRSGATSDGLPELGAAVNRSPLEELKIVIGEIDAGNNNAQLKRQLRQLLKYVRTRGLLDEEHISSITKEYL